MTELNATTIRKRKIQDPLLEMVVLRGMLSEDKKIAGALFDKVKGDHFSTDYGRSIFRAIERHRRETGEPPSFEVIVRDLKIPREARRHFREFGLEKISTVRRALAASKSMQEHRSLREAQDLCRYLAETTISPTVDMDRVKHRIATTVNMLNSSKSSKDAFLHFGKNNNSLKLVKSILYDDNSESIIPTGIKSFDEESGGFARGALVTIGASSGGGKSIAANTLARNMARMGYKVLLVPLEMSKREMTCRLISSVTKTNMTKIMLQRLASGEKEKVERVMTRWSKAVHSKGGRYTIFKPEEDMTIEEIMTSISAYSCDVVIIDYISLLKGIDGDDQWQALGAVARYAKINAENENRVNILLCQVNDEGKIRYARSITEHSSNSWIWTVNKEQRESGIIQIEQAKSRNSRSFPFRVKFLWSTMTMESCEEDEALGPVNLGDEAPKRRQASNGRRKSDLDEGPRDRRQSSRRAADTAPKRRRKGDDIMPNIIDTL